MKETSIRQRIGDLLSLIKFFNPLSIQDKQIINKNNVGIVQTPEIFRNTAARVSFRDIYDTLKNNYGIYRILVDGLEEIKNSGIREECFFTTNYLAERKGI